MALLNYAETYNDVKNRYNVNDPTSGDFVKFFFSKDKHIVTHGEEYQSIF